VANEFRLEGIVPWGRTAAEYEVFFALSGVPPTTRVLDCGGGPASFAAEWGRRGDFVVAVDPIYAVPPRAIAGRFDSTAARMLEGMRAARDRFRWEQYGSPEAVVERRRAALDAFVTDQEASERAGRYVAARMEALPFASGSFDLVLCSHLLFLYSDEIDLQTHLAALREMLRVGREVRVFPLVDMHGQPSTHLPGVIDTLAEEAVAEVEPVPFEFQAGASKMLRLKPLPHSRS
jgi:SAM-dependent methyltransferase